MSESESKIKIDTDALMRQLEDAGIDTSKWGIGQFKTLAHLQKEIEDGETTLESNENGEMLRKVELCSADVYSSTPDGIKYRLKESRQVFKDGRERQRNLKQAVNEKMKIGENYREAMIRGIKEELSIEGDINLKEIGTEQELVDSPSYPGLKSQFVWHMFDIELDDSQFNPSGYTEIQSDKSTFFIWEEVK